MPLYSGRIVLPQISLGYSPLGSFLGSLVDIKNRTSGDGGKVIIDCSTNGEWILHLSSSGDSSQSYFEILFDGSKSIFDIENRVIGLSFPAIN